LNRGKGKIRFPSLSCILGYTGLYERKQGKQSRGTSLELPNRLTGGSTHPTTHCRFGRGGTQGRRKHLGEKGEGEKTNPKRGGRGTSYPRGDVCREQRGHIRGVEKDRERLRRRRKLKKGHLHVGRRLGKPFMQGEEWLFAVYHIGHKRRGERRALRFFGGIRRGRKGLWRRKNIVSGESASSRGEGGRREYGNAGVGTREGGEREVREAGKRILGYGPFHLVLGGGGGPWLKKS